MKAMTLTRLFFVASLVLLVGCNLDDESGLIQNNNNENNTNNANNSNNLNNVNNSNNVANNTNNTNNTNNANNQLAPDIQAFQNCAAGGVAEGGDVQSVSCLGSTDSAGFEASGGDVVWQPGASSVILIP